MRRIWSRIADPKDGGKGSSYLKTMTAINKKGGIQSLGDWISVMGRKGLPSKRSAAPSAHWFSNVSAFPDDSLFFIEYQTIK